VPRTRTFALSTHLFEDQRLTRDHLRDVKAAGFGAIELAATRTHFDYHSESSAADLRGWLADTGLTLDAVHAPVAERFGGGRPVERLNLASSDAAQRQHALDEATRALQMARQLPFATLVVHAGLAKTAQTAAGESSRDGVRRSIETLAEAAEPLGVRIAVEIIPNELSRASSLVHFVEDVLESGTVGICLDLGHAQLESDVADVIDIVSEHVIAVEAHDNRGRTDDHLVPFEGMIDWPGAMTALQKVGYDGVVTFEVTARGSTKETLGRAKAARERIERLLTDL
jgi:sugar phosphate isomerase/epimerase